MQKLETCQKRRKEENKKWKCLSW